MIEFSFYEFFKVFRIDSFFKELFIEILFLLHHNLTFLSSPEPSAPLLTWKLLYLVHFGSRSNPIDGHIQNFLRPYYSDDFVYVVEDVVVHVGFGQRDRNSSVFGMSARVDYTVHVKVQVVHFRILELLIVFWRFLSVLQNVGASQS